MDRTRSRLAADARRRQLLDVGIRIFSTTAYGEVSITGVAREAGVSKGLLYHYFAGKRELYMAAVQAAGEELLQATRIDPALPRAQQLAHSVDAYLAYVVEHELAYTNLLLGADQADGDVHAIVQAHRDEVVTRTLADLPPGQVTGLTMAAVRGWVGFTEAATVGWLTADVRLPRHQIRDLCVRMLLDAVEVAAVLGRT